ncbi:hypothetical protein H072_10611 [Dactylellina haptotyla CBS 200.50]|uniref:Nucleoside phosphorylase domain-containing protein n=1 Tax=Dactylellina haptotyla (strain CBS 200.50) TaxID=1284197 RepID=S8A4A7_DACHA|nr:hypothetical protein H072_10611 [Dactylellina haptotyla CBS 200.50]
MAAKLVPRARTHGDYKVGWVCAQPKEQTAATAMLDEIHKDLPKPPKSRDSNSYTLGSIGEHDIVIASLPKGKGGAASAASVAVQMINTFPNIKFGLMVGVGGGIPNKSKIRLGDVVVSSPTDQFPGVVQWDLGKATSGEGGTAFERTGALNNPPQLLLTALSKLETGHELDGSKIPEYLDQIKTKFPRLATKYLKSDTLEDVLFKPEYAHIDKAPAYDDNEEVEDDDEDEADESEEDEEEGRACKFCDKTKAVKRKPLKRDMRIHYGLIASGNKTINDAI